MSALTAAASPVMFVSGATSFLLESEGWWVYGVPSDGPEGKKERSWLCVLRSEAELCMVVENGAVASAGALVRLLVMLAERKD